MRLRGCETRAERTDRQMGSAVISPCGCVGLPLLFWYATDAKKRFDTDVVHRTPGSPCIALQTLDHHTCSVVRRDIKRKPPIADPGHTLQGGLSHPANPDWNRA